MSHRITIASRSAEQTWEIGKALGAAAQPGDTILLSGEFGVGKTVLTQGLAAGLGVPGQVSSPSFVLMVEHQGRLPLFHVDLYRIEGSLDDEMLDSLEDWTSAGGVCAIEWPNALPGDLRIGATVVEIQTLDEDERLVTLISPHERLLAPLRSMLEA